MRPINEGTAGGQGQHKAVLPTKNYIMEKCAVFGENMRTERKARGFTTDALAKFLNISTAYVGLIERGERCPSLEMFLKICDFFGESCEVMLKPRKNLSVEEVRALRPGSDEKDQASRKRKTIMSMVSTFTLEELSHIISIIKSFKTFNEAKRTGEQGQHQDMEAADEFI